MSDLIKYHRHEAERLEQMAEGTPDPVSRFAASARAKTHRETAAELERLRLVEQEACTSCGWIGEPGEEVPEDRCPECNEAGSMTTFYGDPEYRIQGYMLWGDAKG